MQHREELHATREECHRRRANLNQQNPRKLKLEANIHKPSGHGKIVGITDYGTRSTS